MEDLGFFNEREAEWIEREEALSSSDLEKLNVREDMPEIERAEQLLKNGLEKQKISVLSSLAKILAGNNSKSNLVLLLDCIKAAWQKHESEPNSAIPLEIFKGLADLSNATVDGKLVACPSVNFHDKYVEEMESCRAERKNAVFLLSEEQIAKLVVPQILDFLTEIQHKDFAEHASGCLIAALPRLGGALKKTQIIRVAIDKGDVSQTPGSRLICCHLLGAVTAFNLLTSEDIEGLFFQKMMALCQDTDADVRKTMCIQLDGLARAVGEEKACTELLPELLELLQDEVEQVKQMAFLCILSLLDFFPTSERLKHIVPQVVSLVETLPDYLETTLAEQFGVLVTKLATLNLLTNEISSVLIECYASLYSKEDVQIRSFCAYNYPAVVKALGLPHYAVLLDDLLPKFSQDSNEKVRLSIAAGLHEIALLLGPVRALRYLKSVLLKLLKDESIVVEGMMLHRVPQLIGLLFSKNEQDEQQASLVEEILKAMTHYHEILPSSRQREHFTLVEMISKIPSWCTSAQMHEVIEPLLFELIDEGARPVQLAAIQTLIKCIRRNDVSTQRYALLTKLRGEFGHSRSFWRRMLYLDACVYALDVNSRQYCRLNFLDVAMELIEDPVPNVRSKAISLLPLWKKVLTFLSDEKLLERIRVFLDEENPVDPDRDVANVIADVRQSIDTTSNDAPNRREQDEVEEKRKVSEEESLSLVSDHEDSSSDSKWSSMLEYTLIVGKDGQVVRRARVKSLDVLNKTGKKDSKSSGSLNSTVGGNSSGVGGSSGIGSSGLGGVGGAGSMTGGANMSNLKMDGMRKQNSKALSKTISGGNSTTLPNCSSARPLNSAKAVPPIKMGGSVGKIGNLQGSSGGRLPNRGSLGTPKENTTKIPIIRPTAPTTQKPRDAISPPSSSSKSPSGTIIGTTGAIGSTGVNGGAKTGFSSSTSSNSSSSSSSKPKVQPPSSSKR